MGPTKGPVQNCAVTDKETRITVHATNGPDSIVFIATAKVNICDEKGRSNVCRAMLDPGSQSNIITRNIVQKLGLRTTENIVPISGISHTRVTARESVKLKIKSMHNEFTAVENCLVMPTITVKLPQVKVDTQSWNIPSELSLADPSFQIPGEIDILLGSSIFWKILGTRQWELSNTLPRLQETQLGWIVGRELVDTRAHSTARVCNLVSNDLNHQLEKFWQLEEIQPRKAEHRYSAQDQATEEFFLQTVRRDTDGKYIVQLPKDDTIILGDSEVTAIKRFLAIEQRLNQQTQLREEYHQFLENYEKLGHMSLVAASDSKAVKEIFYLPHHPVIKNDSITTRLRVVFDDSSKSSTGTSLNQKLLSGPNLQQNLWSIMIRFRSHQHVITADIKMMFRQIWVTMEDRNLQRIVWRQDSAEALQTYTLNTVTYGTTCAPYLVMRCLQHLATQPEAITLPAAAEALEQDFYMNDVITGSPTIEQAIELRKELSELLGAAGFTLRKWRASDSRVLQEMTQ
ncbi:PREDICTED: uncharacterized protein LOC108761806 [Trachymyrmex cornetzi]|uniref:uncharacterized protein LOC108761806 n=1 Tax=Trachymyrmex cornetzi TaxID=471704 RepID=UPI00084EFD63|nr:PREDICTED: uncharacterized protein LOC108761806 [Trachymyrmex cornetzi]